jgi:hypothetical protein
VFPQGEKIGPEQTIPIGIKGTYRFSIESKGPGALEKRLKEQSGHG